LMSSFEAAKQWLKDNVEEYKGTGGFKDKQPDEEEFDEACPLTKREYLLDRIAKIEANKKEFNGVADKAIEELHEKMTCDACYLQEDGLIYVNENRMNINVAIMVADFVKDMESEHER